VDSINPELPVDEQADLLPYDQTWEFPREKLVLGKEAPNEEHTEKYSLHKIDYTNIFQVSNST
jgi:hypothetical protein